MKIKNLLLAGMLFGLTAASGQEYLQMIDEGNHLVADVIENAENYFIDKDKGRGSGYKQFKRWEYMAKRLQNEQGYLTSTTDRLQALEDYNAYLNATSGQRVVLNDNWEELGPDRWNATAAWSPGVGRVTGLDVEAGNSDHIIIGANTGGVWRTIDGAATWTPLGDYFSNLYVYSVRIDPANPDTYFFGSRNGLIYKSDDAGATWNQIGTAGGSNVNKILIHPTNSDIMFASGRFSGIYKSTDGGATWTNVVAGEARGYDIEFKPGDPSVVYASGNSFHVSTDGGDTFTTIGGLSGNAKMIGVSADDDAVVYVISEQSGSFGGLFKSVDSGATFTTLNHAGRNYFGYDTNGIDSGGQAPRDMDITVNPNNVDEVHIAGVLTWRSDDGGDNFENTGDWIPDAAASADVGYHHADVDILEFIGTDLYVGSDGGIFKAATPEVTSATMYEDLTDGLGIRQFYKIGVSQTDPVVVTGGSQDNGTSVYTAANGWIDWIGADGMEGFVDKDDTNKMYGMIQFGGMYRTFNGGQGIFNIPEPPPGSGNWVTPFEQDPVLENTIYCGFSTIYKSENSGNQWTAISQDLGSSIDEMKIAPTNNQVMYAARSGVMYKTTDAGATDWQILSGPGGGINSIAIHPTDENRIAVAVSSGNKVFVSDDGAQTWTSMLMNLPNFSALSVVWDNNGEDGLYVGMDYGIYYIDNTLTEWEPYFNNLPNVIVNEMEINFSEGKIYAGTYGRGLWVSPTKYENIVLGTGDGVLTENKIALLPNPAANEVTIQLTEAMETDIRVFDITGKLMMYQPNVEITGRHTLDISTLKTGVYFVRINSDFGTVTKRLIKE